MNKTGISLKELKTLLKLWQKRLLLTDWDISIKIVEFKRKDFKQSGDIEVFPQEMRAIILLTSNPFRDEEYVLVHELVHLILWDYDTFNEKLALGDSKIKIKGQHGDYMEKLESTVDHLAKAFLIEKKSN